MPYLYFATEDARNIILNNKNIEGVLELYFDQVREHNNLRFSLDDILFCIEHLANGHPQLLISIITDYINQNLGPKEEELKVDADTVKLEEFINIVNWIGQKDISEKIQEILTSNTEKLTLIGKSSDVSNQNTKRAISFFKVQSNQDNELINIYEAIDTNNVAGFLEKYYNGAPDEQKLSIDNLKFLFEAIIHTEDYHPPLIALLVRMANSELSKNEKINLTSNTFSNLLNALIGNHETIHLADSFLKIITELNPKPSCFYKNGQLVGLNLLEGFNQSPTVFGYLMNKYGIELKAEKDDTQILSFLLNYAKTNMETVDSLYGRLVKVVVELIVEPLEALQKADGKKFAEFLIDINSSVNPNLKLAGIEDIFTGKDFETGEYLSLVPKETKEFGVHTRRNFLGQFIDILQRRKHTINSQICRSACELYCQQSDSGLIEAMSKTDDIEQCFELLRRINLTVENINRLFGKVFNDRLGAKKVENILEYIFTNDKTISIQQLAYQNDIDAGVLELLDFMDKDTSYVSYFIKRILISTDYAFPMGSKKTSLERKTLEFIATKPQYKEKLKDTFMQMLEDEKCLKSTREKFQQNLLHREHKGSKSSNSDDYKYNLLVAALIHKHSSTIFAKGLPDTVKNLKKFKVQGSDDNNIKSKGNETASTNNNNERQAPKDVANKQTTEKVLNVIAGLFLGTKTSKLNPGHESGEKSDDALYQKGGIFEL